MYSTNNISDKYSHTVPISQVSLYDKKAALLYFHSMDNAEFNKTVGVYIKTARKAIKLSQEKLGDLFGCSKSNVSGWENGRHEAPFKVLSYLARESGIPLPMTIPNQQKQKIVETVLSIEKKEDLDYLCGALEVAMGLLSKEKPQPLDRRDPVSKGEPPKGKERRKKDTGWNPEGIRFWKPH